LTDIDALAIIDASIAIDERRPRHVADRRSRPGHPTRAADVVITMGCGDACPIYQGKRYEDWELDDPAGQDLEAVRPIRDEIDERVQRLVRDLLS
jgi:protein-tyrosine-phosphatase